MAPLEWVRQTAWDTCYMCYMLHSHAHNTHAHTHTACLCDFVRRYEPLTTRKITRTCTQCISSVNMRAPLDIETRSTRRSSETSERVLCDWICDVSI